MAALAHVPFDGWTQTAFDGAIDDTGADRAPMPTALPLWHRRHDRAFTRLTDRRMGRTLEQRELAALKVREKVAPALHVRFEITPATTTRSATASPSWRCRAMRRSVGQPVPHRGRRLVRRRRPLDRLQLLQQARPAGVTASVFYWLNDTSEGTVDTWSFLDRRIDDVMRIRKLRGKLASWPALPDPFGACAAQGGPGDLRCLSIVTKISANKDCHPRFRGDDGRSNSTGGSGAPRHPRHMAHLAARAGLGLAVEVQLGAGIAEERRASALTSSPIRFFITASPKRSGEPERQAADGADVLLELAGDAGIDASSGRNCAAAAPSR